MIILKENLLIGEGGRKKIYLDPRDNTKCIKITPLERKKLVKKTAKHWYKKIRSLDSFDENIVEMKAHKNMKNRDEDAYNHIPKFYGAVETNFGWGIVVDYLDNIISLKDFITKYGVTDDIMTAIKEMFLNFIKNNIEIRDYTSINYMVKFINNKPKIYLIDGLGAANLIPLHKIPYFGKKQTIRRLKKMLILLKKDFPKYEDKFDFDKIINGSIYK